MRTALGRLERDSFAGWIVPIIVVVCDHGLRPGHGQHSPLSASLKEVFKLSHRWETKVEMEGYPLGDFDPADDIFQR